MTEVGIFFLTLFVLFILSRTLTRYMSLLLYRALGHEKWVVSVMAFVFLPGTFIHEMSHYITAVILRVSAGHIEFTPVVQGDRVKLGSVRIAETDMVRRFLIGIAPVVWGTLVLLGLVYVAVSSYTNANYWVIFLILLLVFIIGNTMYSSKRDMEGALGIFIFLAILFFAFIGMVYFGHVSLSSFRFESLSGVYSLFSIGWKFLLVPVVVDVVLITVFYILLRD